MADFLVECRLAGASIGSITQTRLRKREQIWTQTLDGTEYAWSIPGLS